MSILEGELIKKARKSKGLTQLQLAERVGLSHAPIHHLENGGESISLKNLRLIAKELDFEVIIKDRWISVQEDLPNDQSKVLAVICMEGKFYTPFSCDYSSDNGFHNYNMMEIERKKYKPFNHLVSHWQPLPKPPRNG
jgi:transcriptional regulator with XRE-family HTH domain